MILKPNFQNFRNSELLQFLNDSLVICKQQNPDLLQITKQVTDLETTINTLGSAFKLVQGSNLTEEVVSLDKRRDAYLIGIRTYAEGLTYSFDSVTQLAAQAILESFDKYGKGLYALNYQAETSTITSLINDWSEDKQLLNAITTLNLTKWINELQMANDMFNSRYLSRVDEKAIAPNVNFAEHRKTSVTNFRQLVKHIEARATLSTDTSYQIVINSLNVLIEKYNKLVKGRSVSENGAETDKQSSQS